MDRMLTVNPRSWHYRLYRRAYKAPGNTVGLLWPWWWKDETYAKCMAKGVAIPNNLCGYFWAVMFAPLVILSVVVLLFVFWLGTIIVFPFYLLHLAGEHVELPKWMRKSSGEHEPKVKEPSLFWEFAKAKKRRVCPLLRLEDDSEQPPGPTSR